MVEHLLLVHLVVVVPPLQMIVGNESSLCAGLRGPRLDEHLPFEEECWKGYHCGVGTPELQHALKCIHWIYTFLGRMISTQYIW